MIFLLDESNKIYLVDFALVIIINLIISILISFLLLPALIKFYHIPEKNKNDNILNLNHGMREPNPLDLTSFLEKMINNNVYNFKNKLKEKNSEKLFSLNKFIYKNDKSTIIDIDIDKFKHIDYIYIIIHSNTKNNNTKCNIIQYNKNTYIFNILFFFFLH